MKAAGIKETYSIPPQKCPYCGVKLEFSTATVSGDVPEPGSYSICVRCFLPAVFDDNYLLQKSDGADLAPQLATTLVRMAYKQAWFRYYALRYLGMYIV